MPRNTPKTSAEAKATLALHKDKITLKRYLEISHFGKQTRNRVLNVCVYSVVILCSRKNKQLSVQNYFLISNYSMVCTMFQEVIFTHAIILTCFQKVFWNMKKFVSMASYISWQYQQIKNTSSLQTSAGKYAFLRRKVCFQHKRNAQQEKIVASYLWIYIHKSFKMM